MLRALHHVRTSVPHRLETRVLREDKCQVDENVFSHFSVLDAQNSLFMFT